MSQSDNISPILGEAPTVQIETTICMVGNLADLITCAKFQYESFRGYYFTGVEFTIFLLIFAWACEISSNKGHRFFGIFLLSVSSGAVF